MADTTTKELDRAEAEIVQLRADLELERRQRRQDAANAQDVERTLRGKIAQLERTRNQAAATVRDAMRITASAEPGDVFRQRVGSLEFGVGFVEVGEVPEGAQVVVRVPPGTTSGKVGPVLRELAVSIVQDQVPLDPRRGPWELVRAERAGGPEGLEGDEGDGASAEASSEAHRGAMTQGEPSAESAGRRTRARHRDQDSGEPPAAA